MHITKLFSLNNKVAIVTGGYSYLGKKMSESLAEAGARVFVTGTSEKKCINIVKDFKKNGLKVEFEVIDVGTRESIDKCFQNIYTKSRKIDILINNAYFGVGGNLENISEKEWQRGIDGTINSVYRCTQAIIPYFNKGGNIINITSMYGIVSPDPSVYKGNSFNNPPDYGAGKAAIIQFTRYCAVHLSGKKIRVNAVCPGPFPSSKVQENKSFIKELVKKIPLGRIGKPEELKGIILFLASDASSYITGQNICVDGGWTIW